jgi:hypothetical protein
MPSHSSLSEFGKKGAVASRMPLPMTPQAYLAQGDAIANRNSHGSREGLPVLPMIERRKPIPAGIGWRQRERPRPFAPSPDGSNS